MADRGGFEPMGRFTLLQRSNERGNISRALGDA